jgi:hypothetical protein
VAGGAAVVLTCALLAALAATPAGRAVAPIGGSDKPKLVFFKARVVSDGLVTPGQLETIAVSHMPPRTKVRVLIEPPPTTPECGELYFCDPAKTTPAPGHPPYRTSGKGRALLTFVMPSTYFVETDPFRPEEGYVQTFADGQAVHIDVDGARRFKRVRRVGFGFGRAVVQRPPS